MPTRFGAGILLKENVSLQITRGIFSVHCKNSARLIVCGGLKLIVQLIE